jgi:membrane carboxypeptidase/penicillin-binding protein PbpC
VALPEEYMEWAALERGGRGAVVRAEGEERFRILAPRDGDRYQVPVGVEARYATVALRAAGAEGTVRWLVDGREVAGGRWRLVPGRHIVRAVAASGEWDEVRVVVEP